jgi:hypothetical protein
VLWIERFETFEQLRHAVRSFAHRYNREWLLERHGYRTPGRGARTPARPCRAMIISDRISEARPETASRVAREAAKKWGYA